MICVYPAEGLNVMTGHSDACVCLSRVLCQSAGQREGEDGVERGADLMINHHLKLSGPMLSNCGAHVHPLQSEMHFILQNEFVLRRNNGALPSNVKAYSKKRFFE